MVKIEPLQPNSKSRVSAHSHIKSLGVDPATGLASNHGGGMIGQTAAREAGAIIVELVRQKRMAGRGVLFAGPPGTGKTALSLAMASELGDAVPFVQLVGSEVYSREVKKTEMLMEHVRRAVALRVRETKEVFEGEVTEINPVEQEVKFNGYGRSVSHVLVTLRAARGTKQLRLDAQVYEALLKHKVDIGDVIYIEANNGVVKRVGRCDTFANEVDIESDNYVPLPKGDVHKSKEIVQYVSLHDLDIANAQPQNDRNDVQSILKQLQKNKRTEITDKLRTEINMIVNSYIDEGIGELLPGVLFIDEVHMLDMDCFTFLHRALESRISPVIILATNRGHCLVNGADNLRSPHGIPPDLLDRLLIVPTKLYTADECRQIIEIRAQAEGVQLEPSAIDALSKAAQNASLRYALQLLSPAALVSASHERQSIKADDIDECASMFLDAKTSAKFCQTSASDVDMKA